MYSGLFSQLRLNVKLSDRPGKCYALSTSQYDHPISAQNLPPHQLELFQSSHAQSLHLPLIIGLFLSASWEYDIQPKWLRERIVDRLGDPDEATRDRKSPMHGLHGLVGDMSSVAKMIENWLMSFLGFAGWGPCKMEWCQMAWTVQQAWTVAALPSIYSYIGRKN